MLQDKEGCLEECVEISVVDIESPHYLSELSQCLEVIKASFYVAFQNDPGFSSPDELAEFCEKEFMLEKELDQLKLAQEESVYVKAECLRRFEDGQVSRTIVGTAKVNLNSHRKFYLDTSFVSQWTAKQIREGIPLGHSTFAIDPSWKNYAEIQRVYVAPGFQGRQVGSGLVQNCLSYLQRRYDSAVFVYLGVWEENSTAIRLYFKAGFKYCGYHTFHICKKSDGEEGTACECVPCDYILGKLLQG